VIRSVTSALCGMLATTFASPAVAQPLTSTRVGSGFALPVFAASPPGDPGELFVLQQGGQIRRFNPATGAIAPTPVLDLATIPATGFLPPPGEQGLFMLAFHPSFASNGIFYVNYTFGTTGFSRIERYTYNFATQTATASSRQTVLETNVSSPYHHVDWMGFHPTNGLLYVTAGDGGTQNDPNNRAQSLNTWHGKVLRIDVNSDAFPADPNRNYAVPASNPFVGTTGALPEIFAYGLRNPWRASFDRLTSDLYVADVGQNTREEIDFIAAKSRGGQNFGWKIREGTLGPPLPGSTDPIYDYDHTTGTGDPALEGNSVTGGYVYRGGRILDHGRPLDGTYFFADYVTEALWSFRYDGTTRTDFRIRTGELGTSTNGFHIDNPSSFAEDGFGNLYVIDYGGEIFRIGGTPIPEPGALALAAATAGAWWIRRRTSGVTAARTTAEKSRADRRH
jgi:Glucose / Sorbosone dehydrogenase